ncbi:hypothetical protein PGQ11_009291 [Apiospora arundinis]|uniref:Uncharacterized protein n=1 Tax=Apiospora arundinis TaxID=335852 RepID=A0ABR2IHL2_9PEZI
MEINEDLNKRNGSIGWEHLFALLDMSLRGRLVQRYLLLCYKIWSPQSRAGEVLLKHVRGSSSSPLFLGVLSLQAGHTL